MRKIKFLLVAILCVTSISLVKAETEGGWTVKVGVGASNLGGKDANTDMKFSFRLGAEYDISLSDHFSIIPGLYLANKGFKTDAIDGTLNGYFLELPISVAGKINLSDNLTLSPKVGPYIAYGIFGSKVEWYSGGESNYFDDGMYRRFDIGLTTGLSFDYKQYAFGFEYTRGFFGVVEDLKGYNQTISFVFGYKF